MVVVVVVVVLLASPLFAFLFQLVTNTTPITSNMISATIGAAGTCFRAVSYTVIFPAAQTFLSRRTTLLVKVPKILAPVALCYFWLGDKVDNIKDSIIDSEAVTK